MAGAVDGAPATAPVDPESGPVDARQGTPRPVESSWGRDPPMSTPFWKRSASWSEVEFYCGVGAVLTACVTASVASPYKWIPAILGGVLSASVLYCRRTAKGIEEAEVAALRESARAQAHRMVKAILDDFHAEYFKHEVGQEKYKHRVTLFRSESRADGRKLLTIFARSGIHQNSSCTWPLDDDDPDRCRGIAGKIWFDGVTRTIITARDWPQGDHPDPVGMVEYARSLDLTIEEAKSLNVKSKVYTGAPILVRGQRWGVRLCRRVDRKWSDRVDSLS